MGLSGIQLSTYCPGQKISFYLLENKRLIFLDGKAKQSYYKTKRRVCVTLEGVKPEDQATG